VNGHILNVDGGFTAAGLVFDPSGDAEATKPTGNGGISEAAANGNGRLTKSTTSTK